MTGREQGVQRGRNQDEALPDSGLAGAGRPDGPDRLTEAAADALPGRPPDEAEADASPGRPPDELARRLREASAEELLRLVGAHGSELSAEAARQALRNPFVTSEVVERLAAETRLLSFYEVRRELARSPRSPEALALRLVPGLYWRDLVELGLDTRLHPRLRRAADLALAARVPELAVGEKVALARRASPTLLAQLRQDPSPRVIAALLDNPRLTEGILAPLAHSERASAPILQLLANDRRWGARYDLRLALARNPRTPAAAALPLLTTLRKADLRGVAADPRVGDQVRRRARLLLGELERVT